MNRPPNEHPVARRPEIRPRLTRASRLLKRGLLITTLVAILPLQGMTAQAESRELAGPLSAVIGFARALTGLHHRNRVYRSSERFITDRKAYYDGLRETARKQLLNREIYGLRTSQTAAYVKLVGLIERDRTVELQVAESRKRAARSEFHQQLGQATLYVLAGSRIARRLVGALQHGVGHAQNALDRVLNTLTSGGTSGLQDLKRIRAIAEQVKWAGGAIGGRPGRQLRQISGKIIDAIDRPQEDAKAALESLKGELAKASQTLDRLERAGRTPTAGDVIGSVVARHLPGGGASADESMDAVSEILSNLESGDNSLKDEARAALRQGFVARCAAYAAAYKTNLASLETGSSNAPVGQEGTTCKEVEGEEFDRLMGMDSSDEAPAPTPTEEPTEVPPMVSAQGSFSEQFAGSTNPGPPMGTSFTLTADYGTLTISGTLSGSRTVNNQPIPCGTEEELTDMAYAEFTGSYSTQFSTTLDPESGDFSAAISVPGSCAAHYTQPFTVEGCTQFNNQPVPGCSPWAGQGTVSGYVTKDGTVNLTTQWVTGGGSTASGTWYGNGSVSTP